MESTNQRGAQSTGDNMKYVTGIVRVDAEAQRLERVIRQTARKLTMDTRPEESNVVSEGMLRSFRQENFLVQENARLQAKVEALTAANVKITEESAREKSYYLDSISRAQRVEITMKEAAEQKMKTEKDLRLLKIEYAELREVNETLKSSLERLQNQLMESDSQLEEHSHRCHHVRT
mmetsp:Transcript_89232/g.238340  ORF Transcript_89232/g.238340 Transcript_89232/m.238340 type:complete len:177 (-) Transcript_89232:883-1413(-)